MILSLLLTAVPAPQLLRMAASLSSLETHAVTHPLGMAPEPSASKAKIILLRIYRDLKYLLGDPGDDDTSEGVYTQDSSMENSMADSMAVRASLLSAAMLTDITEAHKHRHFRAIIPAIMAMLSLSLVCTCLMGQPIDETPNEQTLRMWLALVQCVSLLIYGYVTSIADDARAHRVMVRVNEINNAFASFGCLGFINWQAANGNIGPSTVSAWSMAQLAGFLALVAWMMNMLAFPSASRNWIYILQIAVFAVTPTYSTLPQPLQALFLATADVVGEVLGRLCYRALLDVYIGQEVEKAKLREQAQEAFQLSYQIENERREALIRTKKNGPSSSAVKQRRSEQSQNAAALSTIQDAWDTTRSEAGEFEDATSIDVEKDK